jgi:hypothetical protein
MVENVWTNVPPDKHDGCSAANTPLIQQPATHKQVAIVCSYVAGDGGDGGEALSS